MGNTTKIEWADRTLNYWIGCTQLKRKGGSACDHCYAKAMAPRLGMGVVWNAPPVRGKETWWKRMPAYQKGAARFLRLKGRRQRVFINSMSDFFDNQADPEWRAEACAQMEASPDVICMLLTKRPENVVKMVPAKWLKPGGWPENVWLGVTVEGQDTANHRIPALLAVPGVAVRFLSMEPLLERVRLEPRWLEQLQWIIVGGESGRYARPTALAWVRSIVLQAEAAGVPVFFKQWGEWCPVGQEPGDVPIREYAETVVDNTKTRRIGKKVSGRTLDGSMFAQFPPERPLRANRRPSATELGFIDRANVPVGKMRRSIHRSHRGEGDNFVD